MVAVAPRSWKTKDGKPRKGYQVSWYDQDGKRQRKLFTGPDAKREANAKRLEVELAEREGESTAPAALDAGPLTVGAAGKRWVGYVERELRRSQYLAAQRAADA